MVSPSAPSAPGGPKVEILLRADSHYAGPQVFDWCRANRVDWVLGLAPNAALCRHVAALEKSTAERFAAAPTHGKRRRFTQFYDAAQSWSRVERIIARVEAGPQGSDTRFIVTNLSGGRAKHLYEGLYCARGQAENHIKAWKNHLAADSSATRPKPTSSACSCTPALLALVVDAPPHAQTLDLARHAVRHLAMAPDQTRRPRHRVQNPGEIDPPLSAPEQADLRYAPRPFAASRYLNAGA